ncbi:hypothetical protein D3C74_408120 [compost metagenome]
MHILQTNLTAEIRRLFRTFEVQADTTGILCGMIHQTHTVRTEELLPDQLIMLFHLFRSQQLANHTAGHRQQTVLDAGLLIFRMQQQLSIGRIFEIQEAGNHIGTQHIAVEVAFDSISQLLQFPRPYSIHILQNS